MTVAHMWWNGDWSGPGLIWGILGTLASGAFWILLFAVIIKLLKSRPVSMGSPPAGMRLLEERYARGEITREEFLQRREVLAGASPGSGASTGSGASSSST